MKRRVAALVAAAALSLACLIPRQAHAAEANVIPDPVLRQCIANAMHSAGTGGSPGTPDYSSEADSISQDDLDALAAATTWTWGMNCTGVASLDGLQNLHDSELSYLLFNDGSISDLTPLAGLTSLRFLWVSDNQVSDLGPLAELTSLTTLDVSHNHVSDLTPLAELTSLQLLYVASNEISDLTPLSTLAGLRDLYVQDNEISDLTPLAGLTGLATLRVSHNKVSDLAPVVTMTGLVGLDVSNNHIADVSPLAGLTGIAWLHLHDNQIREIAPIAGLLNNPPSEWFSWTLANNQITDISSLDWAKVGQEWLNVPSEYSTGVMEYAVTGQSATLTATQGTTAPLPSVVTATGDPNPVAWTVASGDATIDQASGTVTYNADGPVKLDWTDSFQSQCKNPYSKICSPANSDPVTVSFFSGSYSVNVVPAGKPEPEPSATESEVSKENPVASTTGGTARLADGTDAFTLVTTIHSDEGVPMTGYAADLSVTSPTEVTVSGFTDNGDGTYSLTVTSAKPGNYQVGITLDGVDIGSPLSVNFLGAGIAQKARLQGESESAQGLGFLPGEQVHVTVHSDPIDLGVLTADATGAVPVTFAIPADFAVGRHTVEFVGEKSGTVAVAFDVIAPQAQKTITVKTGGSVMEGNAGMALALVFALCAAGVFSLVVSRRWAH